MVHRQRFLVRFWGVRGSYPTPGPHTLRHGGNTACVEVQAGEHTIILDAGSGIIRLGEALMRRDPGGNGKDTQETPLNLTLLFTHAHGDHLVGFPFFAPLFDPHADIHLFGPLLAGQQIEQIVTTLMSPPYFPVDIRALPSRRSFHLIRGDERIIWRHSDAQPEIVEQGVDGARPLGRSGKTGSRPLISDVDSTELRVVTKFTKSHPLDGAVIYRIEYGGKRVIYATDVEWQHGNDEDFLHFIEGANLLIHDAQYTSHDYQKSKHGFGHSTIDMATEAARVANVGELILFHHEPTYDDDQLDAMEAQAQARFARTRSACEGMEIDLLA